MLCNNLSSMWHNHYITDSPSYAKIYLTELVSCYLIIAGKRDIQFVTSHIDVIWRCRRLVCIYFTTLQSIPLGFLHITTSCGLSLHAFVHWRLLDKGSFESGFLVGMCRLGVYYCYTALHYCTLLYICLLSLMCVVVLWLSSSCLYIVKTNPLL